LPPWPFAVDSELVVWAEGRVDAPLGKNGVLALIFEKIRANMREWKGTVVEDGGGWWLRRIDARHTEFDSVASWSRLGRVAAHAQVVPIAGEFAGYSCY
jgi:hypothetical protein